MLVWILGAIAIAGYWEHWIWQETKMKYLWTTLGLHGHLWYCIVALLLHSWILYIAFYRDRGGTGPVRRPLCGHGGGGGGSLLRRGHTHGRRRAQAENVSAEDLDADLDKHLSEAMKISWRPAPMVINRLHNLWELQSTAWHRDSSSDC